MTALTFFTVVADFLGMVGDGVVGSGVEPDVRGRVTFTPIIAGDDGLTLTTLSPRPAIAFAQDVPAIIDTDGRLKYGGQVGVRLVADTSVLELDSPLFYRVTVTDLTVNGTPRSYGSFNFQAAQSDTTINLATVARVPGQPASGIVNTPIPDRVRREGFEAIFSALGIDIPDPLDLTDLFTEFSADVTAEITAAVAALVAGAPGALDTLNELAAALGDDANFAATVVAALAGKQPLDADLTAIAALSTTAFGRSLLTPTDAADARALIEALPTTGNNVFPAIYYVSVQAAIDACAAAGGGTVLLPVGPTYVPTGGVHLASRVTLAGPHVRHANGNYTYVDGSGYYRPGKIDTVTGLAAFDGAYLVPAAASTGPMVWASNYDTGYAVKDLTIFGVDVYGTNITPAAIPSWTNSFAWAETAGTRTNSSTTVTCSVVQPMPQMVGQAITGTGIQTGTTVTAVNVGAKTMTLSLAATSTATGTAAFTIAGGMLVPAVPVSGRQAVSFGSGAGSLPTTRSLLENVYTWGCGSGGPGTTADYRSWSETSGSTTSGSNTVQLSSETVTPLMIGAPITGTGIPANTVIATINPTTNRIFLSQNATATGTGVALTIGGSTYTGELQQVYVGTPAVYVGVREAVLRGVTCFMGGGDGLVLDGHDCQIDADSMMGFNNGWGLRFTINAGPCRSVGAIDSFNNGIYGGAGNAYLEGAGHIIQALHCNTAGKENVKFGRCIDTAIYYLNATDAGLRFSTDATRYSSVSYASPAASASNPVWNTGSNKGVVIYGGSASTKTGCENFLFDNAEVVLSFPLVIGMTATGTTWHNGVPNGSVFDWVSGFISAWRFKGGSFPDRISSGSSLPSYALSTSTSIDALQVYGAATNTLAAGFGPNGALYQSVNTQTLSSNGAVTLDASKGNTQVVTLAANATSSSITNAKLGQFLTIEWVQDATGSRTYVWPTNCKFAGSGVAPLASTTATFRDSATFRYDGTNWREISRAGVRGRYLTVADFGAVGDGVTNDANAILAAAAAVTDGSVLYFPKGDYRFATAGTAVTLSGKSRVAVVFEPGARLLMDNLSAGSGTGHGFLVKGSADGVTFVNAHVEWVTPPSTRSTGDGFQFLGYPSDSAPPGGWTTTTGPVKNVQLINCTTVNAPATGAIFMGCSDVRVVDYRSVSTKADGLHFNACRRVNVNGYTALDTGDDGLAFVTYYHATNVWQSATGPFNQPSLGGWSNYDCAASNIVVSGGLADGLRIAGSKNVAVDNIVVDGKANAGIIVDSAIATNGWHASQGVTIDNAVIESCPQGIQVQTVNANSGSSAAFWTFGVKLSGLTVNNCSNWALRSEGDGSTSSVVSGVHIDGVSISAGSGGGGGGGVALLSLRDSSVRNLRMKTSTGSTIYIEGQDSPLTGALSTLPRHNLVVDNIRNDGGPIQLQDLFGLTAGTIQSVNSPGTGITLLRVKQAVIDSLKVSLANRGNTGTQQGVSLQKLSLVEIAKIVVEHDSNTTTTWSSLQVGGGDATDKAAVACHIGDFVYTNTLNQAGSDVVLQGGGNGPVNLVLGQAWFNGGEASPVWRTSGHAVDSATQLATARNIDGQAFDGTANITVIAPGTHAASSKTTPVDADEFPVADSAASYGLKKLNWGDLKAAIKTYYDAVSSTISNKLLDNPLINTIRDTNGNVSVNFPAVASAVNYLNIYNAAAGGHPILQPSGSDANQNVNVVPAGTGQLQENGVPVVTTTGTQTLTLKTLTTPVLNGTPTGTGVATAATASTLALRDSNANLTADAFIPTNASTVTAAGTLTMTIDSAQVQIFTGSTTHTVKLPTTGVTAGMTYTIINNSSPSSVTVQSSGANTIASVTTLRQLTLQARIDTPTAAADWVVVGLNASTAAVFTTLAQRDSNTNLFADQFIETITSTATAAGTTTMTIADTAVQVFTGSTTQTVKLPTTSVIVGMEFKVVNQSSGAVTVQSSGANTVATVAAGAAGIFMAVLATPTAAADWKTIFNA